MLTKIRDFVPPILGGNLVSKTQTFNGGQANVIWQPDSWQTSIDYAGFNTVWGNIDKDSTPYYLKACPTLTTIIGRKAQAFVNGRAEVLNFNTDNYVRGRHKDWEKVLRKPNPIQTDRVFRTQIYSYLQAYNFCPVLVVKPTGFNDIIGTQLWVLPPQFLKITTNNKYLFTNNIMDSIDKIEFIYDKKTTILDKSSIYMFTAMGMNLDNLTFPDSKLLPLKYPINNLIKNYEARGTIAEKKGAIGILSNDTKDSISTLPLSPADKKQLQEDYSKYGMNKDQWQLIITNASLKYQSMTMPIRDMMLLEMEKADIMAIADAFNYPSVLLASEKGTTYSNQEGAKRDFYQDTIVPESMHYEEQLNECLNCEANGVKICYDFEYLPILQADARLKAQVRRENGLAVIYEFVNNVITWNEMKIAMGQDTVQGMDLYCYQLPEIYINNATAVTGTGSSQTESTSSQQGTGNTNQGAENQTSQ